MLPLLVLAPVAIAASTQPPSLDDARYAIEVGRLDQARAMLAAAIGAGVRGSAVDRLLADLALARGDNADALARYTQLLAAEPRNVALLESAALSAARLGLVDRAEVLAIDAVAIPNATWRAWNVRGAVADMRGDFQTADAAYARALALRPDAPTVLNNVGWSYILRGDWQHAIAPLEAAARMLPDSKRAANNLELARAAIAADLPSRRAGESDSDWAARLNDAGMVAELRGERGRAIAAFARAIEARESWYERAANNLAAVGGKV